MLKMILFTDLVTNCIRLHCQHCLIPKVSGSADNAESTSIKPFLDFYPDINVVHGKQLTGQRHNMCFTSKR